MLWKLRESSRQSDSEWGISFRLDWGFQRKSEAKRFFFFTSISGWLCIYVLSLGKQVSMVVRWGYERLFCKSSRKFGTDVQQTGSTSVGDTLWQRPAYRAPDPEPVFRMGAHLLSSKLCWVWGPEYTKSESNVDWIKISNNLLDSILLHFQVSSIYPKSNLLTLKSYNPDTSGDSRMRLVATLITRKFVVDGWYLSQCPLKCKTLLLLKQFIWQLLY